MKPQGSLVLTGKLGKTSGQSQQQALFIRLYHVCLRVFIDLFHCLTGNVTEE